MFANRFFAVRYFADTYFPQSEGLSAIGGGFTSVDSITDITSVA